MIMMMMMMKAMMTELAVSSKAVPLACCAAPL
jgi:hypothetical protein